jgi:hypothetical protein
MVPGKTMRTLVRIALVSVLTGILLIAFAKTDSLPCILGIVLLLSGMILILPMLKTILWNLYGEEMISFSTKSIVHRRGYGFFKLPPKTYEYDKRLKFSMEVLRDEDGFKEGVLNFFGYDKNNQPYHLFRTVAYMTDYDCKEVIEQIQLIFALDKDVFTGYSDN